MGGQYGVVYGINFYKLCIIERKSIIKEKKEEQEKNGREIRKINIKKKNIMKEIIQEKLKNKIKN